MTGPQVQTKYGIVEGARENDQNVFRGIPFAKPPINELRWCAPEEPESWEGVKVCTEFSDQRMDAMLGDFEWGC